MNFITAELDAVKTQIEADVAAFEAWSQTIRARIAAAVDAVKADLTAASAATQPAPVADPAPAVDPAAPVPAADPQPAAAP